jgi:predicted kinase
MSTREGRLIIVCGLPGAGKTTHAVHLESELEAIRFCPDEWMDTLGINLYDEGMRGRIEALQWELGRNLLKLGQTVIIEWGTWGRSERDALRNGARELGATVELHYLHAPIEVLFERIQARGMEDPPLKMSDFEHYAQIFQAPTAEEIALFDSIAPNGGLPEQGETPLKTVGGTPKPRG